MRTSSILKRFLYLSSGVAFLVGAVPINSYAQDVLTKEKIKAFYAQATAVQLLGAGVTLEFLDRHIHEDSKMTLHMITNMQGVPPQKQTLVYDKKELMKESKNGYEMGNIKTIEGNVISIVIAKDGRSARVKDSSYSVLSISIPSAQGTITFLSEQSALCDGSVVLNADEVIQSKEGVCNVEVNVKPEQ